MEKSYKNKKFVIFSVVWTVVFTTVAVLAVGFHKNLFFSKDLTKPAVLEQYNGEVSFREKNISIWQGVVEGQTFKAGDQIATQEKSDARVNLLSGQEIFLESNTQVRLEKGPHNQLKVVLVKGYITVDGTRGKAIQIESGGKSISIRNNQFLCLSKKLSQKPKIECLKKNNKEIISKKINSSEKNSLLKTSSEEDSNRSLDKPDNLGIVEDENNPKSGNPEIPEQEDGRLLSAKGHEAIVTSKIARSETIWFKGGMGSYGITVRKGPAKLRAGESWIPMLEVLPPSGSGRRVYVQGTPSTNSFQTLFLSPAKINAAGGRVINGALNFRVRAGSKIRLNSGKVSSPLFSSETPSYRLRSLSGIGSGAVEVGLSGFATGSATGSFFRQRANLSSAQATVIVRLSSGAQLRSFLPYLASGRFYVRNTARPGGSGVFIVRGQNIIGSIVKGAQSAGNIRRALAADLVFRGRSTDFYYTKNKSQNALKSWTSSQSTSGRSIYAVKSKQLIPISKTFIQSGQVLSFIGKSTSYLFLNKVQLLDVKN